MIDTNRYARCLLSVLGLACSLTLVGCGGDGLPPRYAVSGTVTFKGQPLAKGEITFMPDVPTGRGGSAVIKDGAFKLTTQEEGDGAFPGSYTVIITDLSVDPAMIEAETKKAAEKSKSETIQPDQAAVARATKAAKNTIPDRYGRVRDSGLKATVEEKSNTFKFELTE